MTCVVQFINIFMKEQRKNQILKQKIVPNLQLQNQKCISPPKIINNYNQYTISISRCSSTFRQNLTQQVLPTNKSKSNISKSLHILKENASANSSKDSRLTLEQCKQKIKRVKEMFFTDKGVKTKSLRIEPNSPFPVQFKASQKLYNKSDKTTDYCVQQTKSFNSKESTRFQQAAQQSFRILTINNKKQIFRVIRFINEGCFGKVYLVQHVITNFLCCLKVIRKQGLSQQETIQTVREIKIQSFLSHPNIVAVYGLAHDNQNIYLLLEVCLDGNLFQKSKRQEISQKEVVNYIRQTCSALSLLHQNDIIHRDIKLENILLHESTVKICDFGWAVHSPLLRNTQCGTPLYFSPEFICGEAYSQKIDVWALGIITYELFFKRVPFEIRTARDLSRIVTDDIYFSDDREISNNAKSFIEGCLMKNCNKRWSISQAAKHGFLSRKILKQANIIV